MGILQTKLTVRISEFDMLAYWIIFYDAFHLQEKNNLACQLVEIRTTLLHLRDSDDHDDQKLM